ncbi:MAG: hypothetical protein U9Q81_07895 [Pseudomonadota bacterium]|nr:hypothetical protein [Pseudomonadota bacterium]
MTGRFLRIARVPESREDYVDVHNPEYVIAMLRKRGARADVFSFWQRLPETTPQFPYKFEWDNVAALRVTSYDDWISKQVHPSVRTKLRKAARMGLTVDLVTFDDKLISGISEIFNETPIRQGRPYEHYGKSVDQIRKDWSVDAEASVFIAAHHEQELIGFVKLTFTERYAEMSGTICKLAHRNKPAMSLLIGRAVQFCEAQRIPWLSYGKFEYGNKGEDSLSDFKRYNGFEKVQLPRYYVPLSLYGRIGLKFGLHRRLRDQLPTSIKRTLLRLRSRFYARRRG